MDEAGESQGVEAGRSDIVFGVGREIFGRNDDVDVSAVFGVVLDNVHFLEVLHAHLEVSAVDLDVQDYLLVAAACQSVPVLLVGSQSV
jgi:hypothetical protein